VRRSLQVLLAALVFSGAAVTVSAQSNDNSRVEVSGGFRWIGPIDLASVPANETTAGGGTRALFDSATTLDQSFGREGIVQFEPKRAERMHVTAVAAQPDGKILVAGINGVLHEKVVLFRLRQNGSLDPSFGKRGRVVVRFRDSKRLNGARQLLVEPDGHVLVAGFVMMKGDWRQRDSTMALLRLRRDGGVDRGFGRRGWVVPPVGAYSEATGLALQHGMILLAGLAELRRGRTATVLLRYRRDGTLDRSFGRGGQVRSAGPGRAGHIEWETARVLPTRQRLILVHGGIARPVLAYTPNGKPLPGYARGAKLVPGRTTAKYLLYGPAGALQGGRPVLAWNAGIPAGGKKIRTTARLQRLGR